MQQPNPRIIAGAVDLSALRAKPQPAPAGPDSPEGAPAGPSSPHVIDVDEASFQAEILERSLHTPVVIDFWAEWCGPCKQLSPVLEKLAAEGNGAWVLARIDVDANQRLAAAFRVQSIPMVVAIVGGQPVDAFAGVQPEAQLRQWLAAVVKAGGGGAAAGEEEPALDPRIVEADDKLQAGDFDAAEAAYKALLAESPGDPYATSGLAQLELFRRLETVDPGAALAAAEADPDDVAAQTVAADVEFASGEAARAFDRLIATVRRTAGDDRDAARTHLLGLFAIASPDDPLVAQARRQLTTALF